MGSAQGWSEYYLDTGLAQNEKHKCSKNIVLEYYWSTDFPVVVLVCSVLVPGLAQPMKDDVTVYQTADINVHVPYGWALGSMGRLLGVLWRKDTLS